MAKFSHILGHLKIIVFKNDIYGPSKIILYTMNPNFHVHQEEGHCPKADQWRNKKGQILFHQLLTPLGIAYPNRA